MGRYRMNPRKYNRFKTMGYDLICKICDCPIDQFDEVETKAGGRGKGPKFYHAMCYDSYHLEFDDGKILDGLGQEIGEEDENDKSGVLP